MGIIVFRLKMGEFVSDELAYFIIEIINFYLKLGYFDRLYSIGFVHLNKSAKYFLIASFILCQKPATFSI